MRSALLVHSGGVYLYSSECRVTTFWPESPVYTTETSPDPRIEMLKSLSYWCVSSNPRTLVDHKLADC